jgi:hypothetical protein
MPHCFEQDAKTIDLRLDPLSGQKAPRFGPANCSPPVCQDIFFSFFVFLSKAWLNRQVGQADEVISTSVSD